MLDTKTSFLTIKNNNIKFHITLNVEQQIKCLYFKEFKWLTIKHRILLQYSKIKKLLISKQKQISYKVVLVLKNWECYTNVPNK